MPENTSLKKQEPTAKIVIVVEDGGQFGFSSCGHCGALLGESYQNCPSCGIKLEGTEPGPTFGGSDF